MNSKLKPVFVPWGWPCTIVQDRYTGTYSNGVWLAWPLEVEALPLGWRASDTPCAEFWERYDKPVGRGNSPSEAFQDLARQMRKVHYVDLLKEAWREGTQK